MQILRTNTRSEDCFVDYVSDLGTLLLSELKDDLMKECGIPPTVL